MRTLKYLSYFCCVQYSYSFKKKSKICYFFSYENIIMRIQNCQSPLVLLLRLFLCFRLIFSPMQLYKIRIYRTGNSTVLFFRFLALFLEYWNIAFWFQQTSTHTILSYLVKCFWIKNLIISVASSSVFVFLVLTLSSI